MIKHLKKKLKYGQKLDKTAWNMAKIIQHGENNSSSNLNEYLIV